MPNQSKLDYLAKYTSSSSKKKKKLDTTNLVIDQDLSIPAQPHQGNDWKVIHRSIQHTSLNPQLTMEQGFANDEQEPSTTRRRYDSDDESDSQHPLPDKPTSPDHPAQTVYRNAQGKKVMLDDLKQEALASEKAKTDLESKKKLWMMGRVQLMHARSLPDTQPATKPSNSATDLDDPLRDRYRWGDPGSVFGVTPANKHTPDSKNELGYPLYQGGGSTQNRYSIPPGYRWDGIDRSNGFEQKLMIRRNELTASETANYKWRSEDM